MGKLWRWDGRLHLLGGIRLAIAALLFAALATVDDARAQVGDEGPVESVEYKRAIQEALREYALEHWDEAAALFAQAHALRPSARTFRGMALAAFESRKYVLALQHSQAALDDARNRLNAVQRREVADVAKRADAFVARVRVGLVPARAELTADGAVPARDPRTGELLLDPGEHELAASAPGFVSRRLRVVAVAGARSRVALALESAATARRGGAQPSQSPPSVGRSSEGSAHTASDVPIAEPSTPLAVSIATYGGLAVAVLGLGTSAVTGLMVFDKTSDLESACPGKSCSSDEAQTLEEGDDLAVISNVAFGVGAAGLVAGVVGLVLMLGDGAESEGETPTVSPGARGVVLGGRF